MGPRDQIEIETLPGHGIPGMPIASRPDVLVFQTAPLNADVSIAGNIRGILWISSDAPDTDFFLKLLDVHSSSPDYPNGYAFPVSEGILRVRYRDSFEQPCPMEPDTVYRIEIDMQPSSNLFKAGHRIRLDICSSRGETRAKGRSPGHLQQQPRKQISQLRHQPEHGRSGRQKLAHRHPGGVGGSRRHAAHAAIRKFRVRHL